MRGDDPIAPTPALLRLRKGGSKRGALPSSTPSPGRRGRVGVGAIIVAVACLFALTVIRYWPREPLAARIASSTALYDINGELLRLTLANDEQYRLWTPLEKISPQLVQALLLHEDQHFYRHPGVNPVSLTRATYATFVGGHRQGGSTVTMQLARELYGLNTRTVIGKTKQIVLALGLEMRFAKRDILEAHLNLMPYGGNLQGVGTAALVYFGLSADKLALPQALTLVVIPQSPTRRDPQTIEPETLRAARVRLFERWAAQYPEAQRDAELMNVSLRYRALSELPFHAPHFSTLMLGRNRTTSERYVHTTLRLPQQRLLERVIDSYIRERERLGIHNAAALLVDRRDMSVRAMVGSANFFAGDISGQVNGVMAKRSPGSALKPFIYALALDQGLIHPLSILKDASTNYGGFSPENFDGRFAGPLTATEALTRSRNIPAVTLASRLSEPSFYQLLRAAGISKLASEQHYGLSLALGGGEVTMEELTMLYAMLANRGVLMPLRYESSTAASNGPRLLSEEAAFVTLDMLASAPRPDGNQWSRSGSTSVAWKTGTSWGFRDAWTVGVFGHYVLAVWVGNFDGSSNPAFVGAEAAAPLYFRIVDALTAREARMRDWQTTLPARLVRVDVCSASGDLPNRECPQTTSTWYIPGVSPIKISDVHRRVWLHKQTGAALCPPFDARSAQSEVFEFWPSDIAQLFAQAGMPRRKPPVVDCANAALGKPPRITSPVAHVTYALSQHIEGRDVVPLIANADSDARRVYWFADETYLGSSKASEPLSWRAERAGRYLLRAVDDQGRADSRELLLTLTP